MKLKNTGFSLSYIQICWFGEWLHIVDVSDPVNPVLSAIVPDLENAQTLAVNGDTVYLLCQSKPEYLLAIIDTTDKTAPVVVSKFNADIMWRYLSFAGDLLYFDYGILDLSRSPVSWKVGSFDETVNDLVLRGDDLFVYSFQGPFRIYRQHDTRRDFTKGDVNLDGIINIVDALLVAQYYVGIINLEITPFHEGAADVNESGNIDIIDALMIAQYYVGLNVF